MRSEVINKSEADERQFHATITDRIKEQYRAAKENVASRHAEMMISLKRQYRIEKQQFRFMLESSLNILDNVLQEELSRASDSKLKTIVATIQSEADELYDGLCSLGDIMLLNSESKLSASGTVIATAYLAKGLEFDKVLVSFCTDKNYHQPIDRHMLYVAVTRAMHSLVITYCGAVSTFLADVANTNSPCEMELKTIPANF